MNSKHISYIFFAVLLILISFFPLFEASFSKLVYDRDLIQKGEIYRIFTGFFVHNSFHHYISNLLVFLFIPFLLNLNLGIVTYVMASLIVQSLFLFFFTPNLILFCGFSGTLYGLITLALLKRKGWSARLMLICLVSRCIWQIFSSSFETLTWPPSGEIHLLGIGSAIIFHFTSNTFSSSRVEHYKDSVLTMKDS